MQIFKRTSRKAKLSIAIILVAASSIFSYSFVDNYFEVSKNLDIFATLFRELNIYYVDETDPGDLMKASIDAMLAELDPYTNYIPESDIEDYRFMTTGQYGGIGAMIRGRNNRVMIAEPYEGFPAQKAGLMAGDLILKINGKSTEGKTTSDISKILKGEPNTNVTLTVERKGVDEPFEAEVVREEIKINDVPYYGMLTDEIGYIKLTSFTETASRELKDAFKDLKENQGMKKVVLDLRGNGGGLLREAVNIVNVFVKRGQEVVKTKGKVKDWDSSHRALNEPLDLEVPVTVLIDGGSASASEIVAGTIQDLDRGVVIGRKSFGKGLVQQTKNLSYNSKLKLTVAKYYIPSGRCIQKIDYSHKDKNGKATTVPDSLIREFKTKGGRVVYDGAGIYPDLLVKEDMPGNVTIALVNKSLIFDYATDYRLKREAIVEPGKYHLTDKEYSEFQEFIKGKDFSYSTRTEKVLEDLKETTQKEKYFEEMKDEYEQLIKEVEDQKKEDLVTFKGEIKRILENEIVSRYFYQKGRVEAALSSDPVVKKAIEVLSDEELYASILKPSFKPDNIKDHLQEEDEEILSPEDAFEEE